MVLGPRQGPHRVQGEGHRGGRPELKVDVTIESAQVHIPNASGASPRSVRRDFSDVVYIDDARRARLGTNSSTETAALPLLITGTLEAHPGEGDRDRGGGHRGPHARWSERSGRGLGQGDRTADGFNLFGRRWEVEHGQLTLLGRASPEVEVEIGAIRDGRRDCAGPRTS